MEDTVFENLNVLLFNKNNHDKLKNLFLGDYDFDDDEDDPDSLPERYKKSIDSMISIYGECSADNTQSIINAINSSNEYAYIGYYLLQYYNYSDLSEFLSSIFTMDVEAYEEDSDLTGFEYDSTWIVGIMALCFSLGKMKDKRACDFLHKCATHFKFYIQRTAIWALNEIGNKESVAVIESIDEDDLNWSFDESPYTGWDDYDPLTEKFCMYINHFIYRQNHKPWR